VSSVRVWRAAKDKVEVEPSAVGVNLKDLESGERHPHWVYTHTWGGFADHCYKPGLVGLRGGQSSPGGCSAREQDLVVRLGDETGWEGPAKERAREGGGPSRCAGL
jgi:hypothetical protein